MPFVPTWEPEPGIPDVNEIELGSLGHVELTACIARELWPALTHAIEQELCGITDLVSPLGEALKSHTGRARGVRTSKSLFYLDVLQLHWEKSAAPPTR